MRQRKLEAEQVRVFHLLRDLDESTVERASDAVMTAIVSVLIDNESSSGVKTTVFLTQGVSVDKGLGRLEVKDSPGWMTTTRFITNRQLSDSLDKAWKHEARMIDDCTEREIFAGERQFGCIDAEALGNKDFERIRIPGHHRIPNIAVDSSDHRPTSTFVLKNDKFELHIENWTCKRRKRPQIYQAMAQVNILQL